MHNNQCFFGTKCEVHDGHSFCQCPVGVSGYMCEIVTDCEIGAKNEYCMVSGGNCSFNQGRSVCECWNNLKFDVIAGKCRSKLSIIFKRDCRSYIDLM